ncbi:MAG: TIGR04086 family membrane protein [Clostridiales bacterium]|nr:TIGR04086 family membrane protein [Clostridiales bacterium]
MQKLKSFKFSSILSIIKCCLLGIVVTLLGVVIFAVVLKFTDLNTTVISYINDVIKAISIFVMVLCIKKANDDKLLLRSIVGGVLYAVLSFVVFSILNGGFAFNLSLLYDLLFSVIVSAIASVIINIVKRKNA